MLFVDVAAVFVPLAAFLGVFLLGADLPDPSLACGVWALKLLRDSTAFRLVAKVLANEARNLLGVMSIFAVVLFVAALIAYAVERDAQPQTFGSIPQAMWWAIVTLSTTGYGDAVPQSFVGRVLAGVVMMSGIGVFALWAGILATGFAEEVRRHDFVNNWQLVSAVPLFRHLGSGELVAIVRALRPRNVPAGAVICRQGEVGDQMFFIVEGRVSVAAAGAPVELGTGAFFGEMALISGDPRSATVTATSAVTLLTLHSQDFQILLTNNPEIAETISQDRAGTGRRQARPVLLAEHLAHRMHHRRRRVGLRHEPAFARQFVGSGPGLSRGDDDLDRRPAVADGGGQPQPVHGSRHVDVGEHQRNVVVVLKQFDRLVRIARLEHLEAGLAQFVGDREQQEGLVLHDQHFFGIRHYRLFASFGAFSSGHGARRVHSTPPTLNSILTVPPKSAARTRSIRKRPKPRRVGRDDRRTARFQPRQDDQRLAAFSGLLGPLMFTWPSATDKAPYLSELVPSSLMASARDNARLGPRTAGGPPTKIRSAGNGLIADEMTVSSDADVHWVLVSRSCASASARRRSLNEARDASMSSPRNVCDAIAETVARMFLMRCSSSCVSRTCRA